MNQSLYLFNPEHDLALANNDPHFNAPLQAKKLARDMAYLPLWYAPKDSYILVPSISTSFQEEARHLFPQLNPSFLTTETNLSTITAFYPWGWDNAIYEQLIQNEANIKILPKKEQIDKIRKLSHRNTTIKALQFLRHQAISIPQPPKELLTIDDVINFAERNSKSLFKAPWSGSGKGLCWSRDKMTASRIGWCRNIIAKQGSVMAEPIYNTLLDFAMEFTCDNEQVIFSGYSLFETDRGIYRSNLLANNNTIIKNIERSGIDPELLDSVKKQLLNFIAIEIAPYYSGMLGIDMFTYEENGLRKLHPCVEINLRMTMGAVARIFYDNFIKHSSTGHFYIDHNPSSGFLWTDHQQRQVSLPLKTENGRITQGYLSLTPLSLHTHYRVRVEIEAH